MRPILVALACSLVLLIEGGNRVDAGQTLYNGISLPAQWPPRVQALTSEPMSPPYLAAPPEAIPIDAGRQLFVDDFLIEQTTLKRAYHQAEYYKDNPVLKPDKPWDQEGGPTAMVFSDGVWFDPQDQLFKMWYMAGYCRGTAYATSKDGIHWEKPALDVKQGTNLVQQGYRDSATVWLDLAEQDPKRRFKMALAQRHEKGWALFLHCSPDGIHWGEGTRSGPCGDRTTFFYNPFRKVWVYSLREWGGGGIGRCFRYWETPDLIAGANWKAGEPPLWVGSDRLDPRRDDLKTQCQLYNLDGVAYESIVLGLFTIWRGQPNDRPKPNEVCLGFSRDGFYWHRPDRRAFIPVSEKQGDWNWGNVQSAGGGCLVVGDKLYFYVSGRAGVPGTSKSGACTTALAFLRRDGFASMDAAEAEGALTTRPVRFSGKRLFVNCDAKAGELRAEALNASGQPIAPFTREDCLAVKSDSTIEPVRWKGADDLSALAGKPVRFRFHLRNGRLFAFWVSPEASGASHGYVAAGGPGLTGPTDTVGTAGYGH